MAPALKKQLPAESIRPNMHVDDPKFMYSPRANYPAQFFLGGLGWNAPSYLTKPQNISQHIRCASIRNGKPLSILERLPSELLAQIVADDSLGATDVIALGLTCDILWVHVLRHVSVLTRTQSGLLCGEKIALLGTHLTNLPPPLEQDKFMKSTIEYPKNPFGNMCEARRVNWVAKSQYKKISFKFPHQEWVDAFEKACPTGGISPNWTIALENELRSYTSVFRGNHRQWMLRNLDTNEFIRIRPGLGRYSDAAFVDHAKVKDVLIDLLLIMNISWGKHRPPTYGNSFLEKISQGTWAGHSFDIVPLDNSKAQQSSWVDVTERSIEDAMVHFEPAMKQSESIYPESRRSKRLSAETPLGGRAKALKCSP
jgi:hypothetical protein